MNGISSTLKDEIKKSKESKHKEKLKMAVMLLSTNVMVAILCLPGKEVIAPKAPEMTLHQGFQMLSLPLTTLVTTDKNPVRLISKDQKFISEKAYLHSKEGENFKVEISESDVLKISAYLESGMIAIPYVEKITKPIIKKRGSQYEMSL